MTTPAERRPAWWLPAEWPAPANVRAGVTLGGGSVKLGEAEETRKPFGDFNLAAHVGDDEEAVRANRRRLARELALPGEPLWLRQTHSARVVAFAATSETTRSTDAAADAPRADGAFSRLPGQVCAVLTADCVPLLLCDRGGSQIAALHVGWRGLCAGIIAAGLRLFDAAGADLLAWVGPHICQLHYEVGPEVIRACTGMVEDIDAFLLPGVSQRPRHARLGLGGLVKASLRQAGVRQIYTAGLCTYANQNQCYSYRRATTTGRAASLIWRS